MAKFLAYFNLCIINNIKEFLGVSEDNHDGSIINTLGKNMIVITKISNQKQVCSWTVLEHLTNKVIYDVETRKYIGVFMNRYIRCWDESCDNINKIKKKKLKKNIHDLFTFNEKTLILYQDGTCESLESAIELRNNKDNVIVEELRPVAEGCIISNVVFFKNNEKVPILTYFVTDPSTESIELIYFSLNLRNLKPHGQMLKIKIKRYEMNVKPVAYVVVEGLVQPSLLTIWSDQRIFMQALRMDCTVSEQNIGQYVSLMKSLKVDQPMTILGLSPDHIVMYGATEGHDGASLLLYNTQIKLVQTKQTFKIYFNNSRLWSFGNHIYLGAGQMLSVIPFRISKEQLSDVIGSQRPTGLTHYIDKEYINEEDEIEESITFNEVSTPTLKGIAEPMEKEISSNIINVKLHKLYNFEVLFDIISEENGLQESVNIKHFSVTDNDLIMSEEFELLACELEKTGAGEFEITERLCPLLIELNAINDLHICLRRYSNISEKMLTMSLNFVVKLLIEKPDHKKILELLNVVLSCSYNRDDILPYMKEYLDLTVVIYILNYLNKMINDDDIKLTETPVTSENFNPEYMIINWISLILDSHYQNLVLTKDTNVLNVLTECQSNIEILFDEVESIKKIIPMLKNIVRGKMFKKEKRYAKWYSIEKIKLY